MIRNIVNTTRGEGISARLAECENEPYDKVFSVVEIVLFVSTVGGRG